MQAPSGNPQPWKDILLGVLGLAGLWQLLLRLLTLKQDRRKGLAEARLLEDQADGGLFQRVLAETTRLEERCKRIEHQRDDAEARCDLLQEDREKLQDELDEVRRELRRLTRAE